MRQTAPSEPYSLTLTTSALLVASRIGSPSAFTRLARLTSSITSPLIAFSPPARSSASARTSTQPPAAAASRRVGAFTRRIG